MRTLRLCLVAVALLAAFATAAHAQSNTGFSLERYEPTAPGEQTFWVDHPWYSSTRLFAGGLTLDYSHRPLVFGTQSNGSFSSSGDVVQGQLVGHVDLAVSFADRVTLVGTLPVVLWEGGNAAYGVGPSSANVGDPRVGGTVRILGQPLRDAFSLHAGLALWIPVGQAGPHAGDANVRFAPKVIAAGLVKEHLKWSLTAAFEYRGDESIGALPKNSGNTVGSELQFGGAIAWADLEKRFSVGPEVVAAMTLTGPAAAQRNSSSLEALLGAHYNFARLVDAGLAVGFGALSAPGTPDFRAILRFAYAPGPEPVKAVAEAPSDRDHDGIPDATDPCPDDAPGAHPDPNRPGCPDKDSDGDGVYDSQDQCPTVAQGDHPDPNRPGCPEKDSDGDGILDSQDQCPNEPAGAHPDPRRPGCPDKDSDGDGVYDSQDQCPTVPAGPHPDSAKPGCPLPDRDSDTVPDAVDACPDTPGAPNPDPKKNGCPGLVQVKQGKIVILQPVYFATDKDVILAKSHPVLEAVANVLAAQPEIKRLSIEGHTDNKGKPEHNRDLSDRRAKSVLKFLVEKHHVAPERLEAHGFGPDKPIADNKTETGRAQNRRVEFRIVEQTGATPAN